MLDPETFALLSEYISTHNIPEFRPVFTLSSVQVWNIVKKYGRMIDVDIHPHTFRHSFAIRPVRSGLDLRRVPPLLGHSNLSTTQEYLQFNDSDARGIHNTSNFNVKRG